MESTPMEGKGREQVGGGGGRRGQAVMRSH